MTYSDGLPPHPIENFDMLRQHLPANCGTFVLIVPDNDLQATFTPICKRYADAGIRMVICPTQTDVKRLLNDIHQGQFIYCTDMWT
jgi:hypothetical protein